MKNVNKLIEILNVFSDSINQQLQIDDKFYVSDEYFIRLDIMNLDDHDNFVEVYKIDDLLKCMPEETDDILEEAYTRLKSIIFSVIRKCNKYAYMAFPNENTEAVITILDSIFNKNKA